MTDNFPLTQKVSPLPYIDKCSISKQDVLFYDSIAEKVIKNNQFAVVTMAGGQGSRLGYKGPKGTYMLNLKPVKKSLFQIMCEDLKRANEKYDVRIPWFVMTSDENDVATKSFFEINNFLIILKIIFSFLNKVNCLLLVLREICFYKNLI